MDASQCIEGLDEGLHGYSFDRPVYEPVVGRGRQTIATVLSALYPYSK